MAKGKQKAYTVKLSESGYRKVRAAADERGMLIWRLLDDAINAYLNEKSKEQAA